MKKFKSLSIVIVAALLLNGAGPLQSAFAECRGTQLDKKVVIAVSTIVASPSTIIAPGSLGACQEVKLMLLWSGSGTKPNGEYLLLSDTNSGFVSTGTLRIPAGSAANEYFDLGEYAGPLYGVVVGTSSAFVSLYKKK